ncbi:MAG: hypothetical protein AAF556_00965 [Pseudomonadota bacterium]
MSILDQISIEQQASYGPLATSDDGTVLEAGIASGNGHATLADKIIALMPALAAVQQQDAQSQAMVDNGAAIDSRTASDCAYPGLGSWAVQLGEATLDGGHTRMFINIVDGFGTIVMQLHGIATDRTFGDAYVQGGEIDHQLKLFAFVGDFFGDVDRVLHPLHPVGDQTAMMALVSQIADAADRIGEANIDYISAHPGWDGGPAQDENTVIATLVGLIGRVVPSFDNRQVAGWQAPLGMEGNLDRHIHRPFDDGQDTMSQGLPPAPIGRIAPFSKSKASQWFRSAIRHQYRTTVPAARLPF